MRVGLLVVVLGVSVVAARPARAQNPTACLERLEDAEVRARNAWLQERFDVGKRRARWWWYGQMTLWAGVAIFQTTLAARADTVDRRFPNTVGAVGGWLTFLQVAAIPHVAAFAPQRFRRAPARTPEERREKLRYGLDLLERAADRQRLGRGPLAHAGPILWTSFWGPYISARFRDPLTSVQLIGGGILLSQFRILTTPQQALRDWEQARFMVCGSDYVRPYEPEEPLEPEPEVDEDWDDGLPDEPVETEPVEGAAPAERAAEPESAPPQSAPPQSAPEPPGPTARLAPAPGGLGLLVTW